MEVEAYSNNANVGNVLGDNEQTVSDSNRAETEQTQTRNGKVGSKRQGSVKTERNYESLEIEEPEQNRRIRSKSIYQKYETNVSNKYKSLIANLVSSLMILLLWGLFIAPSGVIVWALIDFYFNTIDPLVSKVRK